MKVIRRNKTPSGTDIQQEDWSEDYSCYSKNSTIAVYPVAIITNESGLIGRGGCCVEEWLQKTEIYKKLGLDLVVEDE